MASSQEAWWELTSGSAEFVASLRVPSRPHLYFSSEWLGYDDWLGIDAGPLYPPSAQGPSQG